MRIAPDLGLLLVYHGFQLVHLGVAGLRDVRREQSLDAQDPDAGAVTQDHHLLAIGRVGVADTDASERRVHLGLRVRDGTE